MQYIVTPEFHRQLLLKFSPLRLVAVPVVIGLTLLIIFNSFQDLFAETLLNMSLACYYIVVIIGGNYEAATALQEELKGKTWDLQKMSPITPGKLAFGKLFGATSFTWYIAAFLLVIFVYAYSHLTPHISPASTPAISKPVVAPRPHKPLAKMPGTWVQDANGSFQFVPNPALPETNDTAVKTPAPVTITPPPVTYKTFIPETPAIQEASPHTFKDALSLTFFLILAGIAGQAATFLMSFSDLSSARNKLGRLYTPRVAAPFILGSIISTWIFEKYVSGQVHPHLNLGPVPVQMLWFDMAFDAKIFATVSILFFLCWGLIGIYRTARAELMYPQTPIGWLLAVLSISLYSTGFIPAMSDKYFLTILTLMFINVFSITYLTMLTEAPDIEKYKRFFAYFKQKNWRKTCQNLPRWIALLAFVALFYVSTLVADHSLIAFSLLTTMILFAVRDGILIHSIYMRTVPRYVSFYLVLYYALVYAILPMLFTTGTQQYGSELSFLFSATAENTPKISSGFEAAYFFYPNSSSNPLTGILPVAAEICLALGWLQHKRKSLSKTA